MIKRPVPCILASRAADQQMGYRHTSELNRVIETYNTFNRECVWQNRFINVEHMIRVALPDRP
jgi:hypothetical protein